MTIACASAMPAHAGTVDGTPADDTAAANAATAQGAAKAKADPQVQDIVVIGQGQTRQVQGLTQEDIAVAPPGTSPLKVLDKLPSVNFQSATPFGSNEWSTRISVRGFTQNQLGFTLDGVPLGDMSYANFNGLHISRAIISDNIARTELSQGAGALSTASTSNLGGAIQFYSREPSDTLGGDMSATYGSNDAFRVFGRIDTGDLGGGLKAYVSGAFSDTPKWKGKGAQHQYQVNTKIQAPIGTEGSFAFFVNYSYLADDDYVDMWPNLLERKGYDWDYLRYDWDTASAIADNYQENGVYVDDYDGYGTLTGDDAYYDGYGLRSDVLMGANFEYTIDDKLTIKLTPYYHHNRGIGTWWTFYTPTPGGANLSVRGTEYWIKRSGITGSLAYDLFAGNTVEVGGWYEHNDYEQARDYFGLEDTDHSSISAREWPKNPFAYDYDYNFDINTYQYYVQDTWDVTNQLKVTAGWKGSEVDIDQSYDPAHTPDLATWGTSGSLEAKDMFLPQVGVNYRPTDALEFFASYAENMRAFTTTPFITSPTQFAQLKASGLKPETSWTAEGGVRAHLPKFDGSLAVYHVKFDNRLFAVSPCTAIQSCPAVLSNVGSVTTNGVEATGTYRPVRFLSLYASYSYTHAEYDDDVLNGAGEVAVATAGKAVVNQPRHLANAEIAYDNGTYFGRVHFNYQSKRYATYENDLAFDGRGLVDVSLGYRFNQPGLLDGTELQLNVTNVTDKEYVATIGETGGNLTSYSEGDYQYFLVGPPRQWFVTLKKSF
ncbi:TonB-dependent receptor [Stakelama sp. CBK3Z-3]|uniref:TonB-dependent receptor n=1 Tax=Stakelama flava TaxID=2860338 RepID=A0ABS6XN53_9SPHN|nr:TonB-dependent receptor [Stakelama flava]MBW4331629.1 TonB-dependent receptor [Stakelama flava]